MYWAHTRTEHADPKSTRSAGLPRKLAQLPTLAHLSSNAIMNQHCDVSFMRKTLFGPGTSASSINDLDVSTLLRCA